MLILAQRITEWSSLFVCAKSERTENTENTEGQIDVFTAKLFSMLLPYNYVI